MSTHRVKHIYNSIEKFPLKLQDFDVDFYDKQGIHLFEGVQTVMSNGVALVGGGPIDAKFRVTGVKETTITTRSQNDTKQELVNPGSVENFGDGIRRPD